ncbi:hypothetical protein Tco_1061491 [Tanacetum coccineum]
MTTLITTSTTDNQMHNNVMAAGSRDRPPMLAMGRYAQWQSRFLRYIDTRPNGNALTKCILKGPYKLTTITILGVPVTNDTLVVPERTTVETLLTMSPENKTHYELEKEAIHLLLTRIGDEIYPTIDACKTAHEIQCLVSSTTSTRMVKYQKEVNEIRDERIAKNANPFALVATASPYLDPYYQAPKSHKPYTPTSKQSSSTRSNASTKFKGKEIGKPVTPPSESASEEDSDPEQAQRDKDMHKNMALIAKYFKKIYKPTNNNLRTSSNSRNKNVNTTPRYKNDNQTGQFRNQRIVTIAGARETIGSQECKKPKRVKKSTYHKEKTLLCKQAKKGIPLQAEQSNWLENTDKEIDEQELEAHYSFMAKIQEVPTTDSGTDTEPLGQTDQNVVECDDERVVLANLIANLKLDVDENKKIQKQLKKANTSLAHELKECKSILTKTSRTLGSLIVFDAHTEMQCLYLHKVKECECLTQKLLKQTETDLKAELQDKNIVISELKKLIEKCKGKYVETKFDKPSVVRQPNAQRIPKPSVLSKPTPFSDSLERNSFSKTKSVSKTNVSEGMYRINTRTTQTRAPQLPQTSRNTNPRVSTSTGVIHRTNVSRPQLRSTQMKDKVMSNNSQVKFKKTEVEDHHRISRYKWVPKTKTKWEPKVRNENANRRVSFAIDKASRITNVFKLTNTLGSNLSSIPSSYNSLADCSTHPIHCTVRFGNDQFAPILGYRDLVHGNIMIKRVYYIEGLNHNLFSVGQFCNADLEHSHDHFRAPTAHNMEILIKTCLMPLAIKTQNDSFTFIHELKQEMHVDLKYLESLEKEFDELEFDKTEFSNMYDILLQECVSNDVMCSYLDSLSDLDAHTELQCLYLHKVKEYECLAQKLSKQTETVSKEVYTELL